MWVLQCDDIGPACTVSMQLQQHMDGTEYALLEADIRNKVPSTLDTISQVDVAGGCDSNNMRMLRERLERDWVMQFARGFAGVM